MNKIKVSLIVPVYNVEEYLSKCIDSLVKQTLKDIEIILIDDGGKDSCPQIIDEYAAQDSRIIAIHKENGGYGSAINKGLDIATGEYIGIVESDDYIEPDMYEKLYIQAKKYKANVCKASFYSYNSNLSTENQNIKWCHENIQEIEHFPTDKPFKIFEYPKLIMFHPSIWANIYERDFLSKNKIRVNNSRSASYQDFPFMVEIMCKAERITVVHDYLYHWRIESNQDSSTRRNDSRLLIMPEQCEIVKKILIAENLLEQLKEEIYKHFYLANHAFFNRIQWKYKKEYFNRLRHLFADLKYDKTFKYKYFYPSEKKFVQDINNNKYFSLIKKSLRQSLIQIRWNKNHKLIKLFNHNFYEKLSVQKI